jgi:hypothetical protein
MEQMRCRKRSRKFGETTENRISPARASIYLHLPQLARSKKPARERASGRKKNARWEKVFSARDKRLR